MMLTRELALAADRSLRAGNQIECIAITAQIYALLDALEMGRELDSHSHIAAADDIYPDRLLITAHAAS